MSALKGDNVVERAPNTQWYKGPTLLGFLETVETRALKTGYPLRFPVQWVNRPNLDFRGFSGTIEAGQASVGQEVRVLPSGETATIKDIVLFDENLDHAEAGTGGHDHARPRGRRVAGRRHRLGRLAVRGLRPVRGQPHLDGPGARLPRPELPAQDGDDHGQRPGLGHQAPARHQQLREARRLKAPAE